MAFTNHAVVVAPVVGLTAVLATIEVFLFRRVRDSMRPPVRIAALVLAIVAAVAAPVLIDKVALQSQTATGIAFESVDLGIAAKLLPSVFAVLAAVSIVFRRSFLRRQ